MSRYVETVRNPRWMILLAWVAAAAFLGGGVVVIVQGLPGPFTVVVAATFLAMTVFWVGLGLVFDHLRIEVGDGGVRFGYGPFGKSLPPSNIASVAVERYRWITYGGWGIRLSTGGRRAYSVPGYPRGVSLRLRDGRSYHVSSGDPEALQEAVNSLLRNAPSGRESPSP